MRNRKEIQILLSKQDNASKFLPNRGIKAPSKQQWLITTTLLHLFINVVIWLGYEVVCALIFQSCFFSLIGAVMGMADFVYGTSSVSIFFE